MLTWPRRLFSTCCYHQRVHPHACHVVFAKGQVARSQNLGMTAGGDLLVLDFDADGLILGIEILGKKPCQQRMVEMPPHRDDPTKKPTAPAASRSTGAASPD
jgi:uncharacterized protein DUF2283